MTEEIELTQLDCRYESYRIKNPKLEGQLLTSIAEFGIKQPLQGVPIEERYVLLNGFKRYRCARKLKLSAVPFSSVGEDTAEGIIGLLRPREDAGLNILEQARFVDELANVRAMNIAQIACALSRSKSWVRMRLGLILQMSEKVRQEVFAGRFPAYSFMYTLRQFMRMKGVDRELTEQFVLAVSGQQLSVREIDRLAHGFFRGPDSFRQEILRGNLSFSLKHLEQLREALHDTQNQEILSEFERVALQDLERVSKYMQRVMGKSQDLRLKSRAFHAQAHVLTTSLLNRVAPFTQSITKLNDRSRQA